MSYLVQRIGDDDGTFHGAVEYLHITGGSFVVEEWFANKKYGHRFSIGEAFAISLALKEEGYSYWAVEESEP